MSSPKKAPYVEITVACNMCGAKQTVRVLFRTKGPPIPDQSVTCVKCEAAFIVPLSDKIIDGPFIP